MVPLAMVAATVMCFIDSSHLAGVFSVDHGRIINWGDMVLYDLAV